MSTDEMIWRPVEWDLDSTDQDEPLGTKEKAWVVEDDGETRWLLKLARVGSGRVMGEDWAEWVAARVGRSIGVPCADVHPACANGRRGIVSKNIVNLSKSERLVHGNGLLAEKNVVYDPTITRHNPNYTIEAVQEVLAGLNPPLTWKGPEFDAFEVWVGYLVFDALVAGRDRHHENWAVIASPGGSRLAESFDHGNALGFQESSKRHENLLQDPAAMRRWVERGRSHHFAGRPPLVEVARASLNLAGGAAVSWWRQRLESMNFSALEDMVGTIPVDIMSEVSRRFIPQLLRDNQRRLLDAI